MSEKPIVYQEDGKVYYRASALGMCMTALVAARQGFEQTPPPSKLQEVFDAGHRAEEEFFSTELFSTFSTPQVTASRQRLVLLPVTSRISIVGHLDGETETVVEEVKSQSNDVYTKWVPGWWESDPLWKKYAWQVSVYMLATDKRLRLIRFNRDTKDWIDDYRTIPFHDLGEIRDRVLTVEALALEQDLPECTENAWGCSFSYLHKVEELEPVDEPELQALVDWYNEAKKVRDDVDKDMKRVRGDIAELLAGRGKVLLKSGLVVTYSEYETKEHVVKGSKSSRLVISKGKEQDAEKG